MGIFCLFKECQVRFMYWLAISNVTIARPFRERQYVFNVVIKEKASQIAITMTELSCTWEGEGCISGLCCTKRLRVLVPRPCGWPGMLVHFRVTRSIWFGLPDRSLVPVNAPGRGRQHGIEVPCLA